MPKAVHNEPLLVSQLRDGCNTGHCLPQPNAAPLNTSIDTWVQFPDGFFLTSSTQQLMLHIAQCHDLPCNATLPQRLGSRVHLWRQLTKSSFILDGLVHGFRVTVTSPAARNSPAPFTAPTDARLAALTVQEHLRLQHLGVVRNVAADHPRLFAKWFGIPKADMSKARLILDGRCLNKLTQKAVRFQLETVQRMRHIVQPGDWFTTFDISDAYYHLPVHPHSTAWFGFLGPFGSTCELAALPMGYRHSAYILHEVMRVPLGALRQVGVRISMYMDDAITCSDSAPSARVEGTFSRQLFQGLGYIIRDEKCVTEPTQRVRHLGIWFDSVAMVLSLSEQLVDNLVTTANTVWRKFRRSRNQRPSLRQLARVSGLLTAALPAAPNMRLHLHPLTRCITWLLHHQYTWDQRLHHLPDSAVQVLDLLRRPERWQHATRAPMRLNDTPDFILDTDASDWGLGAWLRKRRRRFADPHAAYDTVAALRMEWPACFRFESINVREAAAVQIAVEHFHLSQLVSFEQGLQINCDNRVVLSYIRRRGGRHRHIAQLLQPLFHASLQANWHLMTRYVTSELNCIPDQLSRGAQPLIPRQPIEFLHEWVTAPRLRAIVLTLLNPTLDAFANDRNTLAPRFCSATASDASQTLDGLELPWRFERVYAAPPIPIVQRVLSKAYNEIDATVALLVPRWEHAAWWPLLLQIVHQQQGSVQYFPVAEAIDWPRPSSVAATAGSDADARQRALGSQAVTEFTLLLRQPLHLRHPHRLRQQPWRR
jgi:hypothetical protein